MKRTIKVSQELIDSAKPKDSSHCMVADAIKEQVKESRNVLVDVRTIRYSANGKRYIWLTPRSVAQAIIWFDAGSEKLTPFTFRLGDPIQVMEARTPSARTDRKATVKKNRTNRAQVDGGDAPPLAQLAAGPSTGSGKGPSQASVTSGKFRQWGFRGMQGA